MEQNNWFVMSYKGAGAVEAVCPHGLVHYYDSAHFHECDDCCNNMPDDIKKIIEDSKKEEEV